MFPCVLLAAGASSRMGANKMLLPFPPGSGDAMVRVAARAALDAGCEVYLVVGFQAERVAALFRGEPRVRIVPNPAWERGMAGSIQAGLRAVMADAAAVARADQGGGLEAVFVHHGDMPLMDGTPFLRVGAAALARTRAGLRPVPVFAGFKGEPGHPVLIPEKLFGGILDLEPDGFLKPFLLAHQAVVTESETPQVLRDIDTPDEYARLAHS